MRKYFGKLSQSPQNQFLAKKMNLALGEKITISIIFKG